MTAGFDEMQRIIREVEPPRPARGWHAGSEALPLAVAANRKRRAQKRLAGLFRGELDWIVMKCLEKGPHPPLRDGQCPGGRR